MSFSKVDAPKKRLNKASNALCLACCVQPARGHQKGSLKLKKRGDALERLSEGSSCGVHVSAVEVAGEVSDALAGLHPITVLVLYIT